MLSRLFLMLLCLLGAMNQASGYSVRVLAAHSEEDVSNAFYIELAKLALSKGAGERDVPKILSTVPMNQVRAIRELEKGNLELLWIGTDIQKEKRFRAIRIPLHKGMMGYRRFIINKQDENKFSGIETVAELSTSKCMSGCSLARHKNHASRGLKYIIYTHSRQSI